MSVPEKVDITVTLSGTYWQDKPQARIYVDDTLIFDNEVTDKIDLRWSGELAEGRHKLIVELHSKNRKQTVLEDGVIVKDQLLNIEEVSFDDISIGFLKHKLSRYEHTGGVDLNCVNLGLNGRWTLPFKTPVYIWLLENL